MAEIKNPISERVKKMAAILQAAQKAAEEIKKEEEVKGQGGMGQPAPSPVPRPS